MFERVRQRLGADGLAGAGRSGEVEGQAQAAGVPLGQAPLVEDQVVLPHQRQGVIERAQRGLGAAPRRRTSAAGSIASTSSRALAAAEEEITDGIGHARKLLRAGPGLRLGLGARAGVPTHPVPGVADGVP